MDHAIMIIVIQYSMLMPYSNDFIDYLFFSVQYKVHYYIFELGWNIQNKVGLQIVNGYNGEELYC